MDPGPASLDLDEEVAERRFGFVGGEHTRACPHGGVQMLGTGLQKPAHCLAREVATSMAELAASPRPRPDSPVAWPPRHHQPLPPAVRTSDSPWTVPATATSAPPAVHAQEAGRACCSCCRPGYRA
jgi:hypothetical protein